MMVDSCREEVMKCACRGEAERQEVGQGQGSCIPLVAVLGCARMRIRCEAGSSPTEAMSSAPFYRADHTHHFT